MSLPRGLKWHKGLLGATGPERLALLQAEQIAKERAFGEAYHERCEQLGSILVDAHDLAVRSVVTEWTRYDRRLLAIVTVYHRSAGRVRVYRWNVDVSRAAGKSFDRIVKQGLKTDE